MESLYTKRRLRLLVGIGVPIGAVLFVLSVLWVPRTPPCPFYTLTGLYCPGCGAGRCVTALLHFRFYAAFRYNPLMVICLPAVAYYLFKVYFGFVFGRDVLPVPKIRARALGVAVLITVIAYSVLRNIPVYPLTLLAPTAV